MNHLIWENSNPKSKQFDDIYFSIEGGLAETNHVFIEGNNLPSRWKDCDYDFTIIETGFGTGLNLFATYKLWLETDIDTTLNFISIEKYPLNKGDIKKALSEYKELSYIIDEFLEQYPSPEIRLKNCNINIYYEDIKTALPKIDAPVDAWFLDGFSPAKNPQMWCEELYNKMQYITKPNGIFSTFTCASKVRKGLQDKDFLLQKTKGFGKKREMLKGIKTL
jgi:tRNA 5-methylaminomethyl-2-thiouridine biosynthesis bifunctional protein